MNIKEIQAKSVLTPSKLPGADFIGRWKYSGEEQGSFFGNALRG